MLVTPMLVTRNQLLGLTKLTEVSCSRKKTKIYGMRTMDMLQIFTKLLKGSSNGTKPRYKKDGKHYRRPLNSNSQSYMCMAMDVDHPGKLLGKLTMIQ